MELKITADKELTGLLESINFYLKNISAGMDQLNATNPIQRQGVGGMAPQPELPPTQQLPPVLPPTQQPPLMQQPPQGVEMPLPGNTPPVNGYQYAPEPIPPQPQAPPLAPPVTVPSFTQTDIARAAGAVADLGKRQQLIELFKTKYGIQTLLELDPQYYGALAMDLREMGAAI